jgi:hypothetical protein
MKRLKTKEPGLSIPVKLDSKTTIMIKAGEDPAEAIARYREATKRATEFLSLRQKQRAHDQRKIATV